MGGGTRSPPPRTPPKSASGDMAPEALFGGVRGGYRPPGEGAQEVARNSSKPLEPAGTRWNR
eukprot:7780096-Alexandrium_andersonii.AAC.1